MEPTTATWVVLTTALLGNGNRAAQLFDLINPVRHASSPEGVVRYKVEPYVVCANVYGVAPHTGRGGWAWYTGSAAWLYRVGLEAILGFRLQGKRLEFNPCVPPGWAGYEVTYRHRSTTYHILVDNRQVSVAASEACQLMGARCRIVRLSWWMMAYNTQSRLRSGCNLDAEKSWKPRIPKHPEKNQTSC